MKCLRWPAHAVTAISIEITDFAAEHGVCVVTCRGLMFGLHDRCDAFDNSDVIGAYTQYVNLADLHGDILDAMKMGFDDVHRRG